MNKRNPIRILVPILLVLAVAGAGYWLYTNSQNSVGGPLTASGTVETTNITVAPEAAGKIVEVKVEEGAAVKTGDVLFRLDDSLIQAQRQVAAANLALAKANFQTNSVSLRLALDNLVRSDTPRAQAELALANAKKALDDATTNYNNVVVDYEKGALDEAKQTLDDTRVRYAYVQKHHADGMMGQLQIQSAWKDVLKAMQLEQAAEQDYQNRYGSGRAVPSHSSVEIVSAQFDMAKALVDDAQFNLDRLGDRTNPDDVKAAQARIDSAQALLDQAQANLNLIDAQIAKTVVTAPVDGVVLTRAAEPGSVVNPGAALIVLGRLDELTLTVYVPEDRIGEVILGETTRVAVDSFPGTTFQATVTNIADQAEFTPRNVQTVEGRKSTVFAVKLKLQNTDSKLKPGMPADVTFVQK
jgi:HlyD family secretion protein